MSFNTRGTEKQEENKMLDRTSHSTIITVTPEQATIWLRNNPKNRPLTKLLVEQYARAMTEVRWRVNGETIKIASDGRILDGQHRLQACVLSGRDFKSYVVTDLDPDFFDTIDIGKKRTAGDILGIDGCRSAHATAAAIRWIVLIRSGQWHISNMKMSADEVRDFYKSEPRIEEAVSDAQPCFKILRPGMAGALYYLFNEIDPEDTATFFRDLADGASLESGDPVLVLREKLIKIKMQQKSKLDAEEIFVICLRAWNRRRQNNGGSKMLLRGSVVRTGGKKSFPKLI